MTAVSGHQQPHPLLVGLLVDVSASMQERLPNNEGKTLNRLQSLQRSLDDLVAHIRSVYEDSEVSNPPFEFFAYGFGFGNVFSNALRLFSGAESHSIRSLLTDADDEVIVPGAELLQNWKSYRAKIASLSQETGGTTPLVGALSKAEMVFARSLEQASYGEPAILLVVSDGLPTDPVDDGPDLVRDVCKRLKKLGVVVVSCFVEETDLAEFKTLYAEPNPEWSKGARLMFECASALPAKTPFWAHLREHAWKAPNGAKLFAQINQSNMLNAFVRMAVSPLEQTLADDSDVRVFVSYSHHDKQYVSADQGSLLSYLRALEHENVVFWHDQTLSAGDIWDPDIREQLEEADIALVLVSQPFLNSSYCMDVEAESFIRNRLKRGLRIVPVFLSACDWQSHEWLSSTLALPADGKNIESHFSQKGKRKELYLSILQAIRAAAEGIRESRAGK